MGIIKQQWNKITERKDAIQLLKEDHQEVDKLFKQFESAKGATEKQKILRKACEELIVHARIEEDLFYPAVRQVLDAKDMMDEAEVEHQSLKQLIAELGAMQPKDDLYDAKVTVLSEYVKHHVREEQDEMFPKVEKADIDLNALGEELYLLRQELKKQLARRA